MGASVGELVGANVGAVGALVGEGVGGTVASEYLTLVMLPCQ